MRNLLARAQQDLLAHELGHQDLVGLVGAHALGEPTRALRQIAGHHVHKGLDVEALGGRHHDLVVKINERAGGLELLEHLFRTGKVGLGEHEDFRRLGRRHALGHPSVAAADGGARVDHERDHVHVGELAQGALVELGAQAVLGLVDHALGHPSVAAADGGARVDHERDHVHVGELAQGALVELGAQAVLGLVDTGGVHDHELAVLAVDHGAQAAAGGLGHRRGDGHLRRRVVWATGEVMATFSP